MMDNISPYFFPEQSLEGLIPAAFMPAPIKIEPGSFMPTCSSMSAPSTLYPSTMSKPSDVAPTTCTPLLPVKSEPMDPYFSMMTTCTSGTAPSDFPLLPSTSTIKTEPCDSTDQSGSGKKKSSTKAKSSRSKKVKQEKITDHMVVRKKHDRFKGMPEEEVLKRILPDHLRPNLDIIIVGINPGLFAAYVGHHYAGPGNHFWKCLFLSGFTPEQMNAYDDHKLLDLGIGFTNIVERTSRGSADLTRKEIKEGAGILAEKIKFFKPKIVAFNGKGIYEVFLGNKNFYIGKQPDHLEGTDTTVYVMPSSSARCSQLPRAIDKVPFYLALKKLRDHLRGDFPNLDESEVCFPDLELKVKVKEDPDKIKEEPGIKLEPGMENCAVPASTTTKPKKPRKSRAKSKVEVKTEIKTEIKTEPGLVCEQVAAAAASACTNFPSLPSASCSAFSTVTSNCPSGHESPFTSIKIKEEKMYNHTDYPGMSGSGSGLGSGSVHHDLHMPPQTTGDLRMSSNPDVRIPGISSNGMMPPHSSGMMPSHTHSGMMPSHTHSGMMPSHTHSGMMPSHTHSGMGMSVQPATPSGITLPLPSNNLVPPYSNSIMPLCNTVNPSAMMQPSHPTSLIPSSHIPPPHNGMTIQSVPMPYYLSNTYFPPQPMMPPLPGFPPLMDPSTLVSSYPPSTYPLTPIPFTPASTPGYTPNPPSMFPMVKQEPLSFGYEQHINY